jgi:hypothetical protein
MLSAVFRPSARQASGASPKPSAKRPRNAQERAASEQRKHVRVMQQDLYDLLDRHPDSRRLMRNLYRVERMLRHGGLADLEAAPSRVLVRALDELERLVWDWSPVGLAELRSRIAVLLKTRPVGDGVDNAVSSQGIDMVDFDKARVDVSEVAHDDFEEEMERSWKGQQPTPAART